MSVIKKLSKLIVKHQKWFLLFLYIALPLFLNLYLTEGRHLLKRSLYLGICAFGLILPWLAFPRFFRGLLLLYLPIYVIYWLGCCHNLIFKVPLNRNSVLTMLDSNPGEAKEFIHTFYSPSVFIVTMAILISAGLLFARLTTYPLNRKRNRTAIILAALACLFAWCKGFHNPVYHRNQLLPYRVVDAAYEYHLAKQELLRMKQEHTIPEFTSIRSRHSEKHPQTYVIVIGESANRNHLEWYGYQRETSPYTKQLPQPYIFKNILSPHSLTLQSLRKVLTFAHDDKVAEGIRRGSIVNIFNSAGFKTFWFSNQLSRGKNDNLIGIIGSDANEAHFINDNNDYLTTITKGITYDEKLLPLIRQALDDPAPRKVIFVHLMGSHSPYDWRIPAAEKHFSLHPSEPLQKFVDNYDDTVRYTDKILAQILTPLLKTPGDAYLLYFSDHGEDISASPDSCRCHIGDEYATPPMYEIPLLLWLNKSFKQNNPELTRNLPGYLNRKFNSQHLIHSIPYLSGLSLDEIEADLNLFAPDFKPNEV